MSIIVNDLHKSRFEILPDIPVDFFINGNYSDLLWEYIRSIFYVSQIVISKSGDDKHSKIKQYTFDDAASKLEVVLEKITELEQQYNISKLMELDDFMNNKLKGSKISSEDIVSANSGVKEIFNKKGLGENNAVTKMIDSISEKLASSDLSQGNIIQNMFSIAQSVADEMKADVEKDPESFQRTVGAISDIFKDTLEKPADGTAPIDMSNMLSALMSSLPKQIGDSV